MASPITGYAIVLTYIDGSGIQGAFGPYATKEAAEEGQAALKEMPIADGNLVITALFGTPRVPEKKPGPVYRTTNDSIREL